ncbi:ATP-binding protein [Rhodococcus fascians]|uniref:AlbA family DNA-binding domain-containing protein n=1 Tax=Rhodococcoides fascians TaxID=1828 RepID=UPI001C5F53FD|nr:ATP-binding protein [Rhodococcus fascians]MBW4781978.1 ATP-binding protein [Rhodococcus fascians]
MADYPALRAIFGIPVAKIDAAAIERAIADNVVETDQLDWKSKEYGTGKGEDIAKDVAAFANHRGGIIVLGVREKDSAADESTPVSVSSEEVKAQVRSAVAGRVQPFLGGITVRQTDAATDGGGHYVVIEVAPSRDAPHALSPGGPNGNTLSYPVRNGAETRYLKEFEVAARYRDRVASRADIFAALQLTHDNGIATVRRRIPSGDFERASISVAAVPVNAGSRPVGVDARLAETEFLTEWVKRAEIPGHEIDFVPYRRNYVARPAPQRTVFTTPDTVIELDHHGAGFLCHPLDHLPLASDVEDAAGTFKGAHGSAVLVPSERIEWALFVAISFLIDHAVDTGASGEVELRAQLHFRHESTQNGGICIRIRERRPDKTFYELPIGSQLSPATTPVQTTTVIPDVDRRRAAAAAAFFLATEMFAEFGVDEPHIFDDTGDYVPGNFRGNYPGGVSAWLTEFHDGIAENLKH